MPAFRVNPTVFIWGQGRRAACLARKIGTRQPVIWGSASQESEGTCTCDETISGCHLLRVEGTAGDFTVVLAREGEETRVRAGNVIVVWQPAWGRCEPAALRPGAAVLFDLQGLPPAVFLEGLDKAKDLAEDHRVFVLADHARVSPPGGERLFQEARSRGIVFFRPGEYTLLNSTPPRLLVHNLGRMNKSGEIEIDGVYTYAYPAGEEERASLARALGLKPGHVHDINRGLLSTCREGVYLFADPGYITASEEEYLLDSLAARVARYADGELQVESAYRVRPERCALCLSCLRVCPHDAVSIDCRPDIDNLYHAAARIDELACRACGACRAECPNRAVEAITADEKEPASPMFLACENSGGMLLRRSGDSFPFRLFPCAGAISMVDVLAALKEHKSVFILACVRGKCQHEEGNLRCEQRLERLKEMVAAADLACQVRIEYVSPVDNWGRVKERLGV